MSFAEGRTELESSEPERFASGRLLPNRQPRGRAEGGGEGCLLLLALPFLGMGLFILLVSANIIPSDPRKFHAPRQIVGICGMLFFIAGLLLFAQGLRQFFWKRRAAEIGLTNPHEPWLADYSWNPAGAADNTPAAIFKSAMFFCFLSLFLVPFNWWAFWSKAGNWLVVAVVALFDCFLLGVAAYAAYLVARLFKYGRGSLRYAKFPFFTGETVEVFWRSGRPIGVFKNIEITLRLVEERPEMLSDPGVSGGQRKEWRSYELYAQTLPIKGGGVQESEDELPLSFKVPANVPGTKLTGLAPRYWELEIHADTPGVDYEANFLVPVYAKAAGLAVAQSMSGS